MKTITPHDIYVTVWGELDARSLPSDVLSILQGAPTRKDGMFDMRFRASKAAYEAMNRAAYDRFLKGAA